MQCTVNVCARACVCVCVEEHKENTRKDGVSDAAILRVRACVWVLGGPAN